MAETKIEWTDLTLNPTTGCDRVSPGCDNCYALTMARRLKAMGSAKYQRDGDPRTSGPGFGITEHPDVLAAPLRWRKPRRVFVNSTSDLFHSGVSDDFIARVWATMAATPQHTYQVLTKRHGRMESLLSDTGWPAYVAEVHGADHDGEDFALDVPRALPNIWLGVSVEDQKRAALRIGALRRTPAAVRFLSCEPLLGPVDLAEHLFWATGERWPREELHWVIVGGESGTGARPMSIEWARQLVEQCQAADVPVFVKQLGSAHGPGKGGDMSMWPPELRVREWPRAALAGSADDTREGTT